MKRVLIRTLCVTLIVMVMAALCACLPQSNSDMEDMDMLSSALEIIKNNYIGEMDVDKLDTVAAEAVINSLDNFTYVTDTMYSQSSDSSIGIAVTITKYNEYYVSGITEDWPAADVFEDGFQLQRGDEIYGLSNSNIVDDAGEPIFYRLRGLSRTYFSTYSEGGVGTVLTLRIVRDGVVMGDYAYTKKEGYVSRATFVADVFGEGSNVGYIQLKNFTFVELPDGSVKSAADDFVQCMSQFKESGMTKLVLDLRGNGGGSTSILSKVASYFVPLGNNGATEILRLEYAKSSRVENVNVTEDNYIADLPLVILCDGSTASAAEALIGACRAYNGDNTTVIGQTTYGKGVFQRSDIELYDKTKGSGFTNIMDKYYVVMVSGYYYIIDAKAEGGKYCIHENPLVPDISVTPNEVVGGLVDDAEMIAARNTLLTKGE